jgi:hypothetical protein
MQQKRRGVGVQGEEEFYEIDFPLTNPETHNIGT